MEDDSS